MGINVHDPRWGTWVEKAWHVAKGGVHGDYNRRWAEWLRRISKPTPHDVIWFAEELAVEYTIPWGP